MYVKLGVTGVTSRENPRISGLPGVTPIFNNRCNHSGKPLQKGNAK